MAAHEFDSFRSLARKTFGLDLKPGKEELVAARLRRLVHSAGFRTFFEYYRHVTRDSTGEALADMIDALATNHTSFLRESDHFDFLRGEVAALLAPRREIEVWCAACATGEEVWTLAFVLNDLFPSHRIQITGSDISNKALRFAQAAIYPAERCGPLPPEWLAQYFVDDPAAPGMRRVHPRIRAQANFRRINLIEPFPCGRLYPVIFCRNVMIYFDSLTQAAVVNHLANCLEPGGYLFVGHAESLARIAHRLEYVRPAVYRKPHRKEAKWKQI